MSDIYTIIDFSQEQHGLGESGLLSTDVLHVYINGVEVKTFDDYLFEFAYPYESCWNSRRDRACFVVRKQAPGTFPALDDEFDCFANLVLCVFDIHENDVVKEIPVSTAPLQIQWDEAGDFPVLNPEPETPLPQSSEDAQFEYEVAKANMNTLGPVLPDDPMNDPTRLEYWLFYYDERYVREPPYEYAARMRNQYLKDHNRPIPYSEDILSKKPAAVQPGPVAPVTVEPAPQEPPEQTAQKAAQKEADRKRSNRIILWSAIFLCVLFLAIAAILARQGKSGAAGGVIFIPLTAVLGAIFRITRGYQPAIPGYYNLWRLLLFFGLMFSTATYQVARLVNRLVAWIANGTEYPGWTFLGVSIPLVILWAWAVRRKGRARDIDEAKKWGWIVPVCAALIFGLLFYVFLAYK